MNIKSLRLQNFRSYHNGEFHFINGLNLIIGPNGTGKTNLIEAVHLLTQGKSFRFAQNADFINQHEKIAFCSAKIVHNNLDSNLQIAIEPNRKRQFLNSKPISSLKLAAQFPIVLFSPESLAVIKEGSDYRRSLIDDLLVNTHTNYSDVLEQFKKALRTRNKLLKANLEGIYSPTDFQALYDSINENFYNLAAQVSYARVYGIKQVLADYQEAVLKIMGSDVDISVEYLISQNSALQYSQNDLHLLIKKRALELRNAEMASGVSLVGPQKHDVRILYNNNDSRIYCSQGQQRALILAFKMAQIVYHRRVREMYPILLLDDVLSELDQQRRDCLLSFLNDVDAQIFITTTESPQTDHLRHDYVQISTVETKEN